MVQSDPLNPVVQKDPGRHLHRVKLEPLGWIKQSSSSGSDGKESVRENAILSER